MNAMDHLLARSTGRLETARPRLPGRFESPGPSLDDGAWGESHQERTVRQPDSEDKERTEKATVQARLRLEVDDPRPKRAHAEPQAPSPQAQEPVKRSHETISDRSESTGPSALRPVETEFEPRAGLPTGETNSDSPVPSKAFEPMHDEPDEPRVPSLAAMAQPDLRPAEPVAGPWMPPEPSLAVPQGLVAPAPEPLTAAEPARPKIDVRIGHIEVRQAPPPSARTSSPSPRARRPRATVSLEDYLRRRGS